MTEQQPQYENFIQAGVSILEKVEQQADVASPEAEEINSQIEAVNNRWDKLTRKLGEREEGVKNILDLSTQYYDVLQRLSEWLPDIADRFDSLPPVGTQPEVIGEQKQELMVSICTFHLGSH